MSQTRSTKPHTLKIRVDRTVHSIVLIGSRDQQIQQGREWAWDFDIKYGNEIKSMWLEPNDNDMIERISER